MKGRKARPRGAAAIALVAAITTSGLALAGPAVANRKPGRYWGGSTGQDDPLVLTLQRGSRALATGYVLVEGTCADGNPFGYYGRLTFVRGLPDSIQAGSNVLAGRRLSRTGRFEAAGLGAGRFDVGGVAIAWSVSGRLTKRGHGSGTVAADVTIVGDDGRTLTTCHTGDLSWRARSAPGKVYAGATSSDQPVVAEVGAGGSMVSDLRFAWAAACEPADQGGWIFGDHLSGLALTDRRFGDTLQQQFTLPDGGRRTFDYVVDGFLGRAAGTGSLSVKVTDYSPAGAVTAVCDSGRTGWTVRTG